MSTQGNSSMGLSPSLGLDSSTSLVVSRNNQSGGSGGRVISLPSTAPTLPIDLFNSIISSDDLPTLEVAQKLNELELHEYLQLTQHIPLEHRTIIRLTLEACFGSKSNDVISICLSYIGTPALLEFEPEFMNHIFSKYEMITGELLGQIAKIRNLGEREVPKEVFQNLESRLNLFNLCYLVKGAKIPIFHEKPWDYQANPEEFFGDNKAKYYRSQGGSIIAIYNEILKRSEYGFLFPPKEDESAPSLELIKGPRFKDVLRMESPYLEWTPEVRSEDLVRFIKDSPKGVIDISSFLNPSGKEPVDPKELEANIIKARQRIQASKELLGKSDVRIVGMFTMKDGQSACLVFNDHHPDNKELIHKQQHAILHLKEKDGYFPEFIEIRRRVCEHRAQGIFQQRLSLLPSNDSLSLVPYSGRIQDISAPSIINKIDEVQSIFNTPISGSKTSHQVTYEDLFTHLLEGLKVELGNRTDKNKIRLYIQNAFRLTNNEILSTLQNGKTSVTGLIAEYAIPYVQPIGELLNRSLNRIALFAQQAQIAPNFSDRFMKYELITEEIILMSETLDSFKLLNIDLLHELNQTGASKSDGINKQTFAFTSGMNAYSQVLGALFRIAEQPLRSVLSSSNYFEVRIDLPGTKKQVLHERDMQVVNFMEMDQSEEVEKLRKSNPEVIFTDIYPNEVTQRSIKKIKVDEIVLSIIENHSPEKPLNIVIDTSTMHFWEREVKDLVGALDVYIKNGTLNLVLVGSLAKFSMCGLDKFTGGIVQVYNNGIGRHRNFNDSLVTSQQTEPLSRTAQNFFGLLFKYASTDIQRYVETIGRCNHLLYKALPNLLTGRSTAMTLALKESDRIPMLGFQFDNFAQVMLNKRDLNDDDRHFIANLTCLLQYYIYGVAKERELPLNMRTSFGFPHSNLNECYTALRLTCGFDVLEKRICSEYVAIFNSINEELGNIMARSGGDATKEMIINILKAKYGKEDGSGNVNETIKQMRTQLIDMVGSRTTFVDFIKIFVDLKARNKLL